MKRIIALVVLVASVAVMVAGIVLLFISCDGSCGSTSHGGGLLRDCPKLFYFSLTARIAVVVSGVLGILSSICFLILRKWRFNSELLVKNENDIELN